MDAGAHTGQFSRTLTERFGCRCYLVEANPKLAAELRYDRCFAAVCEAALGGKDGRATFYLRNNLEGCGIVPRGNDEGAATADVEVVSLTTLMSRFDLDRIDVLKLDIEGSEFDVIHETEDAVLREIGQITVEFHDFLPFQHCDPYRRAKHRLERIGFACCSAAFRTHGDVLFLNRQRLRIGSAAAIGLSMGARWSLRLRS